MVASKAPRRKPGAPKPKQPQLPKPPPAPKPLAWCPHCGFDPDGTDLKCDDRGNYVRCGICGSQGPPASTPELAAKEWNTRSPKEDGPCVPF